MKTLLHILAIGVALQSCNTVKSTRPEGGEKKETPSGVDKREKPFEAVLKWRLSGFKTPESILLDSKNKVIYVSNINGDPLAKDGNGYLSKVSPAGAFIEEEWVRGLNAPKGMAIVGDALFVADIDRVVEIQLPSGSIRKVYQAPGAVFLNDVTADDKGNVYISNTFGGSKIYRLQHGKIAVWLADEGLKAPNGLIAEGESLYLGSWTDAPQSTEKPTPAGRLLKVSLKDQSIEALTAPLGNLDGLARSLHGILFTDFSGGRLGYYSLETQKTSEILDIPAGSADLSFDKEKKVAYIPHLQDDAISAYTLK